MRKTTNSTRFIILLSMILFIPNSTIEAYEVLYSEDFQDGVISEDWLFYGDPISNINLDRGNPAPSFNNNGDSMGSSGIKTAKIFTLEGGIVLQADIFVSCHARGTWVGVDLGFYKNTPNENLTQLDNMPEYIVLIRMDFNGELAWMCPHLETTLGCFTKFEIPEKYTVIHANKYLNNWQTVKIALLDELCYFFINDTLHCTLPAIMPDSISIDQVGIFLGGKATNWGTALIDNLVVYRP